MRIIAGTARSRTIEAPKGRDTRPTLDRVRENLFNILQGRIAGAVTLDLFGGSGALSLEAVSRGAAMAVMADRDRAAIAAQQLNVRNLGFEQNTRIIHAEWQQTVRTLQGEVMRFDLVFLDPPYESNAAQRAAELILELDLLAEDGTVIIEHNEKFPPQPVPGLMRIVDQRKYGYVRLAFIEREGC